MHNPDRHGRKRRKKYFVFASFLFITFFGEGGWGVLRFKKDGDTRRKFWRESLRGRGLKICSPLRGINSRATVTLPLRRLPPYFLHTGPPGINPLEGAQWFFTPNRTCYLLFFFYPDSGPLNMYFSCSVDIKSSKFQISCKSGKLLCDIPKREDGTVGELVIRNPGPVPFHGLPLWDAKLNDLRYA